MAIDFMDLETRPVGTPARPHRVARPVEVASTPPRAVAPEPVVDLTDYTPPSHPPVVDVPGTSYWVRRRRAEAQAAADS
ncbi:hypothetical protein acdb102_00300 [Acidothermaceae bacterium B102]|nr:hypothetical protein acdb102_00300 [Acidothermaceae bacterium B102]